MSKNEKPQCFGHYLEFGSKWATELVGGQIVCSAKCEHRFECFDKTHGKGKYKDEHSSKGR